MCYKLVVFHRGPLQSTGTEIQTKHKIDGKDEPKVAQQIHLSGIVHLGMGMAWRGAQSLLFQWDGGSFTHE